MDAVENQVGHPITNMLMQQASAGDMSTADHADQGAVIAIDGDRSGADLVERYTAKYEAKGDADQVQDDPAIILVSGVTGPVTLEGAAEAGAGPVTQPGQADQVDDFLARELREQLLEVENLVEGARDAVVRRLEQFDQVTIDVDAQGRALLRVEQKLDRLMEHFGIVWNPGA